MTDLATLPAVLALLLALVPALGRGGARTRGVALLVALAALLRAGSAPAWAGALLLLVRAAVLHRLPRRGPPVPGRLPPRTRLAGRIVAAAAAVLLPMLLLRSRLPAGTAPGAAELAALGLGTALLGVLALRPARGEGLPLVGSGVLLAASGSAGLLAPLCLAVGVLELAAAAPLRAGTARRRRAADAVTDGAAEAAPDAAPEAASGAG